MFPISHFIPYEKNGKWGYIEKKSHQILVEAKYISTSFGGDKLMVEVTPNNHILIDKQRNLSHHVSRKRSPPNPPPYGESRRFVLVDTSLNQYGFRIDVNDVITHISNSYAKYTDHLKKTKNAFDIVYHDPFKINNEWYVIAKINKNWGAVNELGVFSDLFPPIFHTLKSAPMDSETSEKWFYCGDNQNSKGFINTQGERRFYNIISKPANHLNAAFSDNWNIFLFTKEGKVGVIDLTDMELIINPREAKLLSVKCTFNGSTIKPPRKRTADVIDLYFLVEDLNSKQQYYIGEQNNAFKID